MLIDLHTHSLHSDGVLLPAELVRRAQVKEYGVIAITDHVDGSNIYQVIPPISRICRELSAKSEIVVLPGAEITHCPLEDIAFMTQEARRLGALIVVGHGESPVEPVIPGTNRACLVAGVDILAHPGLISREDAELAAQKKIFLELTSRKGHSLTNGHVAAMARQVGARLIVNNDAHEPKDLIDESLRKMVALGAGLSEEEYQSMEDEVIDFIHQLQTGSEEEED